MGSGKAKVTSIQVGGLRVTSSLLEAMREYLRMIDEAEEGDCIRAKMQFAIELPNGEHKRIVIRDDEVFGTLAYGTFAGLPSFFEYAREVEREVLADISAKEGEDITS